jgi:carbon storage regulator CsrA
MALVLTRKLEEKAVLITEAGERIEVQVVAIDRGKVRLSFAAPKSTTIIREELEVPASNFARPWNDVPAFSGPVS